MSNPESSPTRFPATSPALSEPRHSESRHSESHQSESRQSESRQPGLAWTEAESKIRKLHRGGLDKISEDQSWRLHQLELSASRHTGKSPRRVLDQAKAVLSTS